MDVFVINMIPKSLSGETNQDSEPSLSVNPIDPKQMAATAFTPDPLGGPLAPIYTSSDGGNTWGLNPIVPGAGSAVGVYLPTADITLRFGGKSNVLYAGIIRADNLDLNVLRTANYASPLVMTILETRPGEDQPWVRAATAEHVGGTPDRVYVGNNDFGASPTAVVDLSLNAATGAAPAGFAPHGLTARIPTGGQNGPSIRPVIHGDGTVYVAFFNWKTPAAIPFTADVVICRDDSWGQGSTPFNDLIDPGDGLAGMRLAPNVLIPWANFSYLGQERVGSHLSIAVDPRDSSNVYVAWADFPTGSPPYTIHVQRSRDRGVTWSGDLRLIPNGINPALAINEDGHVGFLYQTLTNSGATWETHVEISDNGFAGQWWTAVLAAVPSDTPTVGFHPYLGDYVYLEAVHRNFYGVFSAANTPNKAHFPCGVVYQRNANFATQTLLDVDDVTPVTVSIDPFFFKVRVRTGVMATAIANSGSFGNVCVGAFFDETLTIDNAGSGRLLITSITSSSPEFKVPSVASYPLVLEGGTAIDLTVRFEPSTMGPKSATITVFSDDPAGPHTISVFGVCPAPRLAMVIPNNGSFGKCCVGSFVDECLILNNSGKCVLYVTGISSSASEFQPPQVAAYPLAVASADSVSIPIRFEPTTSGLKTAAITVTSNDPLGPHTVVVTGLAPSGELAVSGSTCFGGVKACCPAERTISIYNVGECSLLVTSVAFKRKSRHWKLVNNPFPATVAPGSCLNVVIRYKANERCPKACEIVIESDDPKTPVKTLDVTAYTVWGAGGCPKCCPDCRRGDCEKRHDECCCEDHCCDDDDD